MSSVYLKKPWLNYYPKWMAKDLEIPTFTAIDMFENTVLRTPRSAAIHYFDSTITYGELNSMANSLAAALADLGVNKGDRVALDLQNIPQFLISQYATWKLGAIVVPLNPMHRGTELEYLLNDSGAKIVIALESTTYQLVKAVVANTSVEKIITTSEVDFLPLEQPLPKMLKDFQKQKPAETMDLLELMGSYKEQTAPREEVSPNDVAHLIYTSGTTGPSKGAMNTHGNIAFNARVYEECCNLNSSDVVLGIAPLCHVTGTVAHLAISSLLGIPVVINYRFDATEVLRLIEKWKVTFMLASVTVFIALLEHNDLRRRDLSSLKKVFSAGAPVPVSVVERFEDSVGIYIHNLYGLTETTSPSHLNPPGTRARVDSETGALSIGFPVPNTYAKIVDIETGTIEMAPGEPGEQVIKGPGVVPGYWGKPEETANAIRDGWLYTGDIVKMDEDGWFYVVDRKKDLIIASGFKVWPRDVEDILYQHPAVKEAAVIGMPDAYRGETVKAFVSLREQTRGKVSQQELIDFCRQRMAAYKCPRSIEIIPEIPKTATGKFLRRALRERTQCKGTK